MGTDIMKWGDDAMFEATPMMQEEGARVTPRVFLLNATPDPLGAVAAFFRMYAGIPTYDLADITDDERRQYWQESLDTNLKAAWESFDMHFFIEGVDRSFTHQMVRQRTAVYAQESLRFAVKAGIAKEAAVPPAIMNNSNALAFWDQTVKNIEKAYHALISLGIPAEDARGLLPHCTTTRLNYKTNFRNLIDTLGNRLCTQAQFVWRSVALGMMKVLSTHNSYWPAARSDEWQWRLISTPLKETFTPVCYKAGQCVFMGKLDRGCTIRDRVNEGRFDLIQPEEWMADPTAGITTEENVRPS